MLQSLPPSRHSVADENITCSSTEHPITEASEDKLPRTRSESILWSHPFATTKYQPLGRVRPTIGKSKTPPRSAVSDRPSSLSSASLLFPSIAIQDNDTPMKPHREGSPAGGLTSTPLGRECHQRLSTTIPSIARG